MSWDDPVDTTSFTFDDGEPSVSHDVERPPFWPLICQAVVLLASLVLFFVTPVDKYLAFGLVGYLLTPFLNVLLLAVLRAIDLKKRSLPWYDRELGRTYMKISSLLTLTGFALAIFVIWRIAIEIAQELV
jgi:amino acid transporter